MNFEEYDRDDYQKALDGGKLLPSEEYDIVQEALRICAGKHERFVVVRVPDSVSKRASDLSYMLACVITNLKNGTTPEEILNWWDEVEKP